MHVRRPTISFTMIICIGILSVTQCAVAPRYRILPESGAMGEDALYVEEGIASYYADKFHGRPTASGEIFDMNRPSAAHKELPLGTVVRVQNLQNGKSIVLRINDRGPFVKGRIIDVSLAAAQELDFVESGTVPVRLEVLQWGKK